ncbi:Hsp70 family protein [Catenuloplanes japonicus]|uniref:Hsp70 family protein n=1 Tax=Catenuloplanes japonicus TaxID=33876 RepID=UPI00068A3B3F|nr:Hsp70 family protein [Catenuloplanes japonicus]
MRLSIDFGTSHTAAAVPGRTLLFDGQSLLPSAVCLAGDRLLTGRDALQWGRSHPEAFEPAPKRRIDDRVLLLDGREIPVADVIGAVLARAAAEAPERPRELVLTHPATWGPHRRAVLEHAAAAAGLPAPELLPEPVAAGRALGATVPEGQSIMVYDFGGGTFDATVIRRDGTGFTVLATEGLPDAGGLDIDEAILVVLAATVPGAWGRLLVPETPEDRRAARQVREEARGAKEMLSRTTTATIYVPLLDQAVVLGREQLETLARPTIERTVTATRSVLRAAGAEAPAAIVMVGGSSRIPLVATMLHRAFGVRPTVVEQPESVVALGGAGEPAQPSPAPPGPVVNPRPARPASTSDGGTAPRRPRPWPVLALVALLAALTLVPFLIPGLWSSKDPDATGTPTPTTPTRSPTSAASVPAAPALYPSPRDVCLSLVGTRAHALLGGDTVVMHQSPDPTPNGSGYCVWGYNGLNDRAEYRAAEVTWFPDEAAAREQTVRALDSLGWSPPEWISATAAPLQNGPGQEAFRYTWRITADGTSMGVLVRDRNLLVRMWVSPKGDRLRDDPAVFDALAGDIADTLTRLDGA